MDYGQLKQRLGRRRGFDGNINRLGDFINDAYMTICGRRSNWSWLRRVAQIHTYGPMAGQTAHSWDVGQNVQGFTAADSPAPSGLHKIMEDTFSGEAPGAGWVPLSNPVSRPTERGRGCRRGRRQLLPRDPLFWGV